MPIEILMPALSPTMTEGTLSKWHKSEGEIVAAGDVIAEIETDKATMEVEAVDEGILGKILVPAGTAAVKVNQVIALMLGEGEDKVALDNYQAKAVVVPQAGDAPTQPVKTLKIQTKGDRVFASPLAKKIAAEKGIDLSSIEGSGPNGRIIKADIDKVAMGGGQRQAPQVNTSELPWMPASTLVPHTMMRKAIARRLTESKQQVPHFYLTIDCNLDRLLQARAEINMNLDKDHKLSVNDFMIKASAHALKKVPEANASWTDEGILMYATADVSVAVAIEGGLVTPIIRQACIRDIRSISAEMKELARKAREGKLKPKDYEGGTFSLTNLGMYQIKEFGAIINPPQGSILAIGAGEKRAIVENDQLGIATVMSCTLSADHRVIDGAIGAEFINAFRNAVEAPLSMLF